MSLKFDENARVQDETPSYSVSQPGPSCLHMSHWLCLAGLRLIKYSLLNIFYCHISNIQYKSTSMNRNQQKGWATSSTNISYGPSLREGVKYMPVCMHLRQCINVLPTDLNPNMLGQRQRNTLHYQMSHLNQLACISYFLQNKLYVVDITSRYSFPSNASVCSIHCSR